MLGFKIAHYPDDEITLKELMAGKYDFSILNDFDGITDITVAPYYAQLDKLFPLAAFLAYINQMNQPIRRFSKVINLIQRVVVALDRIIEIKAVS